MSSSLTVSADEDGTIALKVVMLGEMSTGAKTSLALRYIKGEFRDFVEPTIGAAFLVKRTTLDGIDFKLELWGLFFYHLHSLHYADCLCSNSLTYTDCAGQERYKSLAPMYYNGAAIAIVGFDITSSPSLDVAFRWLDELSRQGPPDAVIALVGNKIDLANQRKVEANDVCERLSESFPSVLYYETSAKTGEGVNELFESVLRRWIEYHSSNDNAGGDDETKHKEAGRKKKNKEDCIIC